MQELFSINARGELEISPEVQGIPEIRLLMRRDKGSPGDHEGRFKLMAKKELCYIVHMNRPWGPYSDEFPLTKRAEIIKKHYKLPEEWEPDNLIDAITELYRQGRTFSMDLLDSAYEGAKKLKEHFLRVDLDERDEKGKPIWDSTKLLKNVSQIGEVLTGIESLKEQIKKEQAAAPIIKGGGTKGDDEDPD